MSQAPAAVDPQPMHGEIVPQGEMLPEVQQPGTKMVKQGSFAVAQPCPVKRSMPAIRAALKQSCAQWGERFVYSWEVNQKRRGKAVVEGGTIKLANELIRLYGNCDVRITEIIDRVDAWEISATFLDLETGSSLTRVHMQRKNPNIGMKDQARAYEISMNIGVSKAIRNVTLNYLGAFAEEAVEEAKKGLQEWVANNTDQANNYINKICEKFEISDARLERSVGVKRSKWTVGQTAGILSSLRGIEDGMIRADDAYPELTDGPSEEKPAEKAKLEPEAKEEEPKKTGRGRPKGAKNKKKAEPAAETAAVAPAEELEPEAVEPEPEPPEEEPPPPEEEPGEPEPEGDEADFDFE